MKKIVALALLAISVAVPAFQADAWWGWGNRYNSNCCNTCDTCNTCNTCGWGY